MKYTTITIKCNYDFVKDINTIMPLYDGFVYDFFDTVKKTAFHALEKVRLRNEPDCTVSAEITVTCPYNIKEISLDLLENISRNYNDVYLMLERISRIPDRKFRV